LTRLTNPLLVGIIGGAHGIKGQLRLKSFTDDPLAISRYGTVYDEMGHPFVVHAAYQHKNIVIASIEGIKTRNQAEALRGVRLYIEREQLPETEADEFYWQDLINLAVFDGEARYFGVVHAVFNFGGGDVLEIKDDQGRTQLVPFSHAAVPVVDLAQGRLVIDREAAGVEDVED